MMTFDASLPGTDATLAAAIDAADWLKFSGGILTGLLTAVVAVALAWWQHHLRFGERAEDRAREEKLAEEKRDQDLRRERRRDEHQGVRALLDNIELIQYRLDKEGPLTEATLDKVGVRACAESAELLARKEIGAVREPLNELAKLLNELHSRALGRVAGMTAGDEVACAFHQGRVVQALETALKSAWVAWEQEWGAV